MAWTAGAGNPAAGWDRGGRFTATASGDSAATTPGASTTGRGASATGLGASATGRGASATGREASATGCGVSGAGFVIVAGPGARAETSSGA